MLMNKANGQRSGLISIAAATIVFWSVISGGVTAQNFDFGRLYGQMSDYTVTLKIQVEISFGTQSTEHEERLMGTIVNPEGLIIFDGGLLIDESPFVPSAGFSFRATPSRIEVTTLAGDKYDAKFVGADRYSGFGFAEITNAENLFRSVEFVPVEAFEVGSWLAAYALLPEFVEPPLAADIGMVSNLITAPEEFPLMIGFSGLEFASVLYNEDLEAVGLLGELIDPGRGGGDVSGMMDSFGRMELPLLGVMTAERLADLIADPPRRGQSDRSWLGITMQSLTADIAEFLGMAGSGGIIVNEVMLGSPADEAGLQIGDIVYAVDGDRINVNRDEELTVFQRQVSSLGVGTTVELTVIRSDGEDLDTLKLSTLLKAAPMAASDADQFEYESFEMTVRNLVFSDFLNYNVEQNSLEGVVVSELLPGGLGLISGLRPADIIQRVNDQTVTGVEEFSDLLTAIESERPPEVVFFVWRFGKTMFVNLRTDWP
jgi:S1-C subfamily serine protease